MYWCQKNGCFLVLFSSWWRRSVERMSFQDWRGRIAPPEVGGRIREANYRGAGPNVQTCCSWLGPSDGIVERKRKLPPSCRFRDLFAPYYSLDSQGFISINLLCQPSLQRWRKQLRRGVLSFGLLVMTGLEPASHKTILRPKSMKD